MWIFDRFKFFFPENTKIFNIYPITDFIKYTFITNINLLPLVILFIELFLLEKQKFSQKAKQRKYWICLLLIFLMLFIVPCLYTATYKSVKSVSSLFAERLSHSHRGDIISGKNYYLTQFRVVATYIRLLFVPVGQNFDYDFAASKSLLEIPTLLCFLLILSILLFAVKIYSRQRMISVGIFWFFLTMSLESSFIPIRNVIFEHRMYLPSVGFFLALCIFIYRITKNQKVFIAVISIITVILSFLTYQRNRVWQNKIVFWKII